MSDWKVGDRVQLEDNGQIKTGDITCVHSHTVERSKRDWYSGKETKYSEEEILSLDVKWDDGEEQKGVGRWDLEPEDSEMERSFRLAVDDAQNRIDEQMDKARAAIREAVKISEETGIPFSASVSPLSQTYKPASMAEKFPEVSDEFASEIAGAYGEYEGWQHSAVC